MENIKKFFDVMPTLITIDGPDGAGKSTFSEILKREIQKFTKAILVRPTRFDSSERSRQIGKNFNRKTKKIKPHCKFHNRFFLEATEANYRNLIIPYKKDGRFIVIDSSELRALAFILEKGTTSAIKDTIDKIANGTLTCGVKPMKRIILLGNPEDLYDNLSTKDFLDVGDPQNVVEVQRRIESYFKAIKLIQEIEGGGMEWIYLTISHSRKPVEEYFTELISNNSLVIKLIGGIHG